MYISYCNSALLLTADSADDDSGDEAERSTTNAADDDLYTFNIVDEDLEDIDQKNTPQVCAELLNLSC